MTKRIMGRRANSEGLIRQRVDKRWEARITLPNGKVKGFYGKTKADVVGKLQAAQRAIADGLPLGQGRETVGTWLAAWLKGCETRVRPSTVHRYQEIVQYHLNPRLGSIKLVRLTPTDVEGMLRDGLGSGQSPQSVSHHRSVLRNALNTAVKHGLVNRNVAALADPPHVPQREFDPMTPRRAFDVLQSVKGDKLETFVTILLTCGLRMGEALGMKWTDVDLDTGNLFIQRTLQRVDTANGKEWRFQEPKTKRSTRTIRLPDPVTESLREHYARQTAERLIKENFWIGEQWGNLVFPNEIGGPLNPSTVFHQFQRLMKEAGLPPMNIHALRHNAASLMGALGVPARVVMETLGHNQISTTMNRYTHVSSEWQEEAAKAMAKGLWGRN